MWQGKMKALTFSYDDGIIQDIRLVEILNRYGLKCTFNLNAGLISSPNEWEHKGAPVRRLTWEEMDGLYDGHEIAVHGYTHARLLELTAEECMAELSKDKEELEKRFHTKMNGMAYAYGRYDESVIAAIEACGLRYARTTKATSNFELPQRPLEWHPTCHHDGENVLALADEFIAASPDKPMLFYIWGHSYEFDGNKNWDRFEELCKKLSGRQDIFYCTNAQV